MPLQIYIWTCFTIRHCKHILFVCMRLLILCTFCRILWTLLYAVCFSFLFGLVCLGMIIMAGVIVAVVLFSMFWLLYCMSYYVYYGFWQCNVLMVGNLGSIDVYIRFSFSMSDRMIAFGYLTIFYRISRIFITFWWLLFQFSRHFYNILLNYCILEPIYLMPFNDFFEEDMKLRILN